MLSRLPTTEFDADCFLIKHEYRNPCADNICYGGIGVDAGGKTTVCLAYVQSSLLGTQIAVNINSKGMSTPRKFNDKYVELGALIHEKNSDPTQFIDFKDIVILLTVKRKVNAIKRTELLADHLSSTRRIVFTFLNEHLQNGFQQKWLITSKLDPEMYDSSESVMTKDIIKRQFGSISTWEDLTTRFLAQFFPPRRTAKLCNNILMFQQHHGESLSEAWTPGRRLRKIRPNEAWDTIKRLAQYENEGWNDAFTSEEVSFNYENTDVEQLLGIMERKVDTLIKNAISLIYAMSKRARSTRGHASSSHNETMEEKVCKFGLFDNEDHQMNYNTLAGCSIHSGDVVDWEFLSNKGLAHSFFDSINTDPFSEPQWANLFQINEPIFRELACEFFALFEFDATPCRYDLLHKGVKFRLGGLEREMHLLEFGWRVGLYSERESREAATHRNTKSKSIRNPRIKLAHRCITMTIMGRKETTNRVTKIDLFYLYCIFREGVPPPHVYRKTSLIKMGVIMELYEGECCWPATREVAGEGGGDDEEGY
ncbi:retrotransposon ORF1 [Tanacetum coccineum]|uniref:Retrotransposon ORF1 n=1 Tax=Tanacetum coccineum TaxID=301880 RepID=A0ABQ5C909_9ASTR